MQGQQVRLDGRFGSTHGDGWQRAAAFAFRASHSLVARSNQHPKVSYQSAKVAQRVSEAHDTCVAGGRRSEVQIASLYMASHSVLVVLLVHIVQLVAFMEHGPSNGPASREPTSRL